ncbi:COX aromatic rich motif-containing protein [Candidatus Saccharibacteria bacterium]|nr:COX aromatic rich motif-containing protein [Candidatus Saccharibacteria bacterium]
MIDNKKNHSNRYLKWILVLLLVNFILLLKYLLENKNIALLNPKGFVSNEQYRLILYSVGILLAIAIPALIVLYSVAWKYRESSTKANYSPDIKHGKFFVLKLWIIPSVFIFVLAFIMIPATHKLDPRKTVESDKAPMTIQVISLRWKWLFIYPEQGIATVNYVQIPIDTPIEFQLTADEAPMSSFWIPNLGGQLYAMTSHINRLNLMAEIPGDYPGSTPEITGAGFAGMRFTVRASSDQEFESWVDEVKRMPDSLAMSEYEELIKPSENNKMAFYSAYEDKLYETVIAKYISLGGHTH